MIQHNFDFLLDDLYLTEADVEIRGGFFLLSLSHYKTPEAVCKNQMGCVKQREEPASAVVMSSKKTLPVGFHEQREPDFSSEIESVDRSPYPTDELDLDRRRLLAIETERDRLRRRRLARQELERREVERHALAERQRRRRVRAERRAREEQAARAARRARRENALRRGRRAVAPDQQGAPDRARAKTPPVVAEESQHGILHRQVQELVLPHGHRRGLDNGLVGDQERLRGQQDPIQANDPGPSCLVIGDIV